MLNQVRAEIINERQDQGAGEKKISLRWGRTNNFDFFFFFKLKIKVLGVGVEGLEAGEHLQSAARRSPGSVHLLLGGKSPGVCLKPPAIIQAAGTEH